MKNDVTTNEVKILDVKKDRLRFTKNKLSSTLAILAIVFDALYFISLIQRNSSASRQINVSILAVTDSLNGKLTVFIANARIAFGELD